MLKAWIKHHTFHVYFLVHLSRVDRRLSSLTFHIFDFFSETTDRNSMKLQRKQDLNILYQLRVFQADQNNKMAALASDWLRHCRLLLWNRWKEIQRNLTASKISMSSTKFGFFGLMEKTRCPPWPLIDWNIFDLSSETAERNSTKLDRKQDLNVLYQVLCFLNRSEKQDGCPGLWLADTFSTSPLKPLNRIQQNMTGSRKQDLNVLYQVCVFGPIEKQGWPPWPLIGWHIFNFSSETAEWNSTKQDRKQDLNVLYQVVFFRSIGKTRWLPWPLICWDIFDFFSSETAEWNSTKLVRKQDLNVLYQVCDFQANRKNKIVAPLLIGWDILDFSSEATEENFKNETLPEARYQSPLRSLCFTCQWVYKNGRPGLSVKKVGGTLYSGARYVALWASCKQTLDMRFEKCSFSIWNEKHVFYHPLKSLIYNSYNVHMAIQALKELVFL